MITWLLSGGIILSLLVAIWWQNGEIQDLEEDVSTLNTSLLLKEAALVENKAALETCVEVNQANADEAERQRQAALVAERNVEALSEELNAALDDVSRGTERFTDEILNTPYPSDFVNWLRDD